MAESQSRYGIMESLNSKKIDAQKRLAALERDVENAKMQHDNVTHNINKQLKEREVNYEDDFQKWKKDKQLELEQRKKQFEIDTKLALQAHERTVAKMQQDIVDKEASYKTEHTDFVKQCGDEISRHDKDLKNWSKMKNLEIDAIKQEIQGYNDALNDLKEVSKESTKKD